MNRPARTHPAGAGKLDGRNNLIVALRVMNREQLTAALEALGSRALEEGVDLEICLYGGAAFVLAYGSRAATKDIDAVMNPASEGRRLAIRVARELELDEDWLNSDVRQFLGSNPQRGRRHFDLGIPGLKVSVGTASQLLAMKALACRRPLPGYEGDYADLRFLFKKLQIRSVAEIQKHVDRHYPDEAFSAERSSVLDGLLEEAWSGRG